MASIVTYSGGLKRIDFVLGDGKRRRSVRLGSVSQKLAESWKARIEAIVADKLQSRPHDVEVCRWLAGLDEKMLARLRKAGLADGVGLTQTSVMGFLERYFATLTCKTSTRVAYGNTRRCLEEFFAGRTMQSLTPGDADAWRGWLTEHEKLSPATIARRIIAARTFWRAAVRWKLSQENPFEGVKGGHQENEARKAFVTREVIAKAMAEAPDAEWKLIIALARYGGLRTPSETYALRWGDIDWERGRMTVRSPKTEHHAGRASRTVPIFPELRTHLLEVFEHAETGSEYVIMKHRLGGLNLRQQFERILTRASVPMWPRLFQNLRASRESELMREYDLATVCKWIGNSPSVAAKHYAMSVDLDSDFRRATGLDTKAQQNTQQSAAAGDGQQKTTAGAGGEKSSETSVNTQDSQAVSTAGTLSGRESMGATGLEPVTSSL